MKEILTLLHMNNYYSQSESVEIAKGKYELPNNIKGWCIKIKRKIKY